MSNTKKKCRQYSTTYLKFGFIPLPSKEDSCIPVCLLCKQLLSYETIKPSRLQNHLHIILPDKDNENLSFFTSIMNAF